MFASHSYSFKSVSGRKPLFSASLLEAKLEAVLVLDDLRFVVASLISCSVGIASCPTCASIRGLLHSVAACSERGGI